MSRLPLIGVTDCSRQIGLHAYHISGDIDVSVAAFAAPCLPVIVPLLAIRAFASDILDGPDVTPITVTPFNIEPIHNSGASIALGTACDSARPAFAVWCEKTR
jgi:putative glutamine amidotransferase